MTQSGFNMSKEQTDWAADLIRQLERADEGLANAYASVSSDDRRNDIACERIGLQRAISIAHRASPSPAGGVQGVAVKPLDEWHEDCGNVVWWCWRDGAWLGEPAYIGTPLDLGRGYEVTIADQSFVVNLGGWPGYHTHWTPHPDFPAAPSSQAQTTGGV